MDDLPPRHKDLSEQLAAWWLTQTDFKTKKALAGFLKLNRDTIGDYFSGKTFPRLDIASRMWELTKITCLELDASGGSSPEMAQQESSHLPSRLPSHSIAAPIEEPTVSSAPVLSDDTYKLGKSLEAKPSGHRANLKGGERNMEKPVVVSFQRSSCPFCMHNVSRFHSCGYCGQSLVWANIPMGHG